MVSDPRELVQRDSKGILDKLPRITRDPPLVRKSGSIGDRPGRESGLWPAERNAAMYVYNQAKQLVKKGQEWDRLRESPRAALRTLWRR